MMKYILTFALCSICVCVMGQPQPCGSNPQMTSFCDEACVVCDIDGFTGINDLTVTGQELDGFCTTQYNNMQYIAFIAGSTDLTIRVDVGNCIGGANSLEVGFFESTDCVNFEAITACDTDIEEYSSATFENFNDLTIGQYYYLVIDGSWSANCEWTFHVLEGTTQVPPPEFSGTIESIDEICPLIPVTFNTGSIFGATFYYWMINGMFQSGSGLERVFTFSAEGEYEICVIAANVCDQAPPSCKTITVREIETLEINEEICDGECVTVNNKEFCNTGTYVETLTLPNGCDSTINLVLQVHPQAEVDANVWICNTDTFFIGNTPYTETGIYSQTIQTIHECDSLVHLDLLAIECEILGSTQEIPVICNGSATGTLIFSVDQGTPPLTYTYTSIFDPALTGTGTTDVLINNEIHKLPASTYQIYITDNFGNDVVLLQEVTEPPIMQIEILASDYGGFNISCEMDNGAPGADGFLTAGMGGGVAPYTYLWSDGQTEQTATGLTDTTYGVTVTDEVGCSIMGAFALTAPPPLAPQIAFNDPTCEGFDTGIIEVLNVSGGTPPYQYGFMTPTFSSETLYTDLYEGDYTVYIEDANGCINWVDSSITAPDIPVIQFPEDLSIYLGDSIQIFPFLNNTSLIDIAWTDSTDLDCGNCLEPYASPVHTATFHLTVTSVDECLDMDSIVVQVIERRRVFMPSAFSPNFDGINDNFLIFGGIEVAQVNKLIIYDRWGNLIFQNQNFPVNDEDYGWDGTYRGKDLNPAVFVWMAEVLYIDGVTEVYSGDILLLK